MGKTILGMFWRRNDDSIRLDDDRIIAECVPRGHMTKCATFCDQWIFLTFMNIYSSVELQWAKNGIYSRHLCFSLCGISRFYLLLINDLFSWNYRHLHVKLNNEVLDHE